MTEAPGDLARAFLNADSEFLEPVAAVAGHGAGHTNGGGDLPTLVEDWRCDANGAQLRLLVVHREPLMQNLRELLSEARQVENCAAGIALEFQRGQYFVAIVRRQECQDGLTEGGAVERTAHTRLRDHAESVRALHNVKIENIVAIQHAEIDGFLGNAGERAENRAAGGP